MAKKYLDDNGLLYFWGKLKAYFATISHTHTKSEITDFPASMTPTSHTHGNIANGGTLQSSDVTIASGDKIVVTDSSNSSKVARTSTAFDGSTTTKALTQKGTFETFLQTHQDISGKVDKVTGMGLSTNDYTTTEKNKLAGIASGAEVNVQADWDEADSTSDAYIANKPTIPAGVTPSSTTPKMDSTAAVGSETAFARGDHVHPKDTSKANLASPTFTGTPKAPTATAGTNTTQIATTAFVTNAVSTAVTGVASFQGTAPSPFAPTGYKSGYYWIVGTAGTYVGETCEAGDMIFCTSNYNSAYSASDFDVIQTNLDITDIANTDIDNIVAN